MKIYEFPTILLMYNIKLFILSSTTVRFRANKARTKTTPAIINAGSKSSHILEHLTHFSEPNTASSPEEHCPHTIPTLLLIH